MKLFSICLTALLAADSVQGTYTRNSFAMEPSKPVLSEQGKFRSKIDWIVHKSLPSRTWYNPRLDRNWAGAIVANGDFQSIEATLTIPEFEGTGWLDYKSTEMWISLDPGKDRQAIMRAGLAANTNWFGRVTWGAFYGFRDRQSFGSLDLAPGDVVRLKVAVDGTGAGFVEIKTGEENKVLSHVFSNHINFKAHQTRARVMVGGGSIYSPTQFKTAVFSDVAITNTNGTTTGLSGATTSDDQGYEHYINCTITSDTSVSFSYVKMNETEDGAAA